MQSAAVCLHFPSDVVRGLRHCGHTDCVIFEHFGFGFDPPHASQARFLLPHVGLFLHAVIFAEFANINKINVAPVG